MIFIVLTFLAALSIEGLGTLVSVIGLSALFGSNPIIIALVVALDLGKLVSVSLLYTHWSDLPKLMKGYALLASAVLMIITSAGAAGYLSSEFQRAIIGTQEGSLKVDVLKKQQVKYEERKKQIDLQIAALPEKTTVSQRLRLMNGFKQEQKELQDKISQIDKDLPALQVAQISTEAHAGPILYIAKAFSISVEEAVKYVILLIIFVFDPLAIFLIIAGNFLIAKRRVGQVYGDIVHHDEEEPPGLDAELAKFAKFDPAHRRGEFPNGFTPPEPMPPAPMPELVKDQNIPSMVIEEGTSLPSVALPEVLPEATQIVQEVPEQSRETITLSSLGFPNSPPHVSSLGAVQPDPSTVVDASLIDQVTGFQASPYPRQTKKPLSS